MELNTELIDNNRSIAIIGSQDTGKTNLAFYFASKCSHKDKYTLGYPSKIEGYKNLSDKNELSLLSDCVLIIDEFGRYFPRVGRHGNRSLNEILDFAEHRNIKLILTAQNNQAIDRFLETKIGCWVMKRLNIFTLKQGGMCKVALNSIRDPRITSDFLGLKTNEFMWFSVNNDIGENGVYDFVDMGIKKDWGLRK